MSITVPSAQLEAHNSDILAFDRVPLLFGPSPVHRLERLSEHLGGEGRDLGEARGLQLGARLRRQQGAQARVPRRRCAGPGVRHACLDRRRPVEPHAPGRGGRRAPRARLRARPGALGRVGRSRLRPGREHPALADHGRRRPALRRPGSTSASDRAGRRRSRRSRRAAASRTRSPRAPRITRSAVTASRAGRTRSPRRRQSSACSSTRSSSAR